MVLVSASVDTKVAKVVGRGGIGKTRLLRGLSTETGGSSPLALRFLGPDSGVEPQDFELLPQSSWLGVAVDAAHLRGDNAAVVAGILRFPTSTL